MDSELQKTLQPKPLPSRSQKAVRIFVFFIGALIAIVCAIVFFAKYRHIQNQKAIDRLYQTIVTIQKQDYEEAMKDTYGGKTPQETLALYISAVEKGDYELASKYFIGTKQKEELEVLKKSSKEEVTLYISEIKKVLKNSGTYFQDGKRFSFDGDILLNLKLYPNGVWKIVEI